MRKVNVIINAGSGTHGEDEALMDSIRGLFDAHEIAADVRLAKDGAELVELAAAAAASDCRTIVAGGGDGTISAVAAEVIKADKTLGVLPLGTLNHFSRDLK